MLPSRWNELFPAILYRAGRRMHRPGQSHLPPLAARRYLLGWLRAHLLSLVWLRFVGMWRIAVLTTA